MLPEEYRPIIDKLVKTPYTPLFNKDLPLILFWTPKCGCTTLNKWFFFQIGLLGNFQQESAEDVHRYRVYEYKKETDYTQAVTMNLLAPTKEIYKLVRNPYKRAVSSFLHTICYEWLICTFNTDVKKGLSFKQFLLHLKNSGESIHSIDRHLAPQYIDGEQRFINNYIKLENFNTHIKEIENRYGLLKAPLSEISKSSHHFSGRMTRKGRFAEEILTMEKCAGHFPTYESLYNKETKELVKEIFAKDFEKYGYSQDELMG